MTGMVSPLMLQLAALTALLQTRQPLTGGASGAPAEDTLLRHEERYWIDTAHSAGLDLSMMVLRRVVAAATLCGASSFNDACALARAATSSNKPAPHKVAAATTRRRIGADNSRPPLRAVSIQ